MTAESESWWIRHRTLLGVLVGGFILRLVAIPFVHSAGSTGDEKEYAFIAHRIVNDGEFIDSNGEYSKRSPLYPMMLAGLYQSGDRNLLFSQILGCVFGSLAIALGYQVSVRLFANRTAAVVTAVVVAAYPGLVMYSGMLQTESLYIAFFLGALWCGYRVREKPTMMNGMIFGCFCGLAALTRAAFLGFFPVLSAAIFFMTPPMKRRLAGPMVTGALMFVLVLLPWTMRNYLIHDEFVPISSWGGSSLIIGNNPYATGTWSVKEGFETWYKQQANRYDVEDPASLNEVQRDRLSRSLAVEYMISHPAETVRLFFLKAHMFWVFPITNSDDNLPLQGLAVLCDFLLLAGVCFGVMAVREQWSALLPLFAVAIFFFLMHSALHAEARYRLPLIPILAVFFGMGWSVVRDRGSLRNLLAIAARRRGLAGALAAITVVYGYTGFLFLQGKF